MEQYQFNPLLSGTKIHFFNAETSTLMIFGDDAGVKSVHIDASGSVNLPTIQNPNFLDSIKQAAVSHGLIRENEEIALMC